VESDEAQHVALRGNGSWWLVGGTLHFDWLRFVLGRRRPSRTSSSSLLSITEERIHASAVRTWLFPAMNVEVGLGRRWGKGQWQRQGAVDEGEGRKRQSQRADK
jgi:hypothetical protein